MKIEKISETQIRCTLSRQDLADRDLKISELAYGSDKAKDLFRELMVQASYECGFEADDIPLMIEAIPVSGDCLVLVVTKVEDPDELDTRFSRFAPSVHGGDTTLSNIIGDVFQSLTEKNEDIAELFKKMQQHNDKEAPALLADTDNSESSKAAEPKSIFFEFDTLNETIRACRSFGGFYNGSSILYKNTLKNSFILYLYNVESSDEDFAKICSILGEYGNTVSDNGYFRFYADEHCESLIPENAVKSLAGI